MANIVEGFSSPHEAVTTLIRMTVATAIWQLLSM